MNPFAETLGINAQELISLMREMSHFLLMAVGNDGTPSTIILMNVPITISVANEWCEVELGVGETKMRVLAPASLIESAAWGLGDSASMLAQYLDPDPTDKDELN